MPNSMLGIFFIIKINNNERNYNLQEIKITNIKILVKRIAWN